MLIKRVGKLFHVVEGTETVLITADLAEAQRIMPEDKKDYTNQCLDDELQMQEHAVFGLESDRSHKRTVV